MQLVSKTLVRLELQLNWSGQSFAKEIAVSRAFDSSLWDLLRFEEAKAYIEEKGAQSSSGERGLATRERCRIIAETVEQAIEAAHEIFE